jgi:hypothetical protein
MPALHACFQSNGSIPVDRDVPAALDILAAEQVPDLPAQLGNETREVFLLGLAADHRDWYRSQLIDADLHLVQVAPVGSRPCT